MAPALGDNWLLVGGQMVFLLGLERRVADVRPTDDVDVVVDTDGYPGGPFGYLPLFLCIELPFQLLSIHAGIPFRILGKLPILAADLFVAHGIASELRRRGHTEQIQAIAAAVWFLNPLLLDNSACVNGSDSCTSMPMCYVEAHVGSGDSCVEAERVGCCG